MVARRHGAGSLAALTSTLGLAVPAVGVGQALPDVSGRGGPDVVTRQAAPAAQQAALATQQAALATQERSEVAALRRSLDRIADDPALERAHLGIVVQVAGTGEILYERAADRRFVAASTTKLVTGAVALHRLGSDYRWETRLVAGGEIRDGALKGDLWIVGGGDPALTREEVASWPTRLSEAGIERIEGDVVGDDRIFDRLPWGRGWMWDDLFSGWGSGVSGLQLSPASIRAELVPGGRVGEVATLRFPAGPGLAVRTDVRTGAPGSEVRLRWLPNPTLGEMTLDGWVPADVEKVPLQLAPGHPTLYLLSHLEERLREEGIAVSGRFRRAREGESSPRVAWESRFPSEPLAEVLRRLLKPSDNQVAETLLRTLGLEEAEGGSADEGLEVVGETLQSWGIEPGAASLADGSGLSRYNELTPMALVRLLRRAWQLPEFATLREALPVGGVDGTLTHRFVATAGDGNVQAKTGSLAGVRTLAGYVEDGNRETLAFAVLINGYDAPGDVAAALEDLLVEQLALFHGPDRPGARRDP